MSKTKAPSERALIAERIAEVIRELELTSPFGGDVTPPKDGRRYYAILFSWPRTLDGLVRVYGPKFILVETNQTGQEKFESEAEAIAFIREHWGR